MLFRPGLTIPRILLSGLIIIAVIPDRNSIKKALVEPEKQFENGETINLAILILNSLRDCSLSC